MFSVIIIFLCVIFLAGAAFEELSKYQDGASDNKTTIPGHGGAGMRASVYLLTGK